MDSSEIKAVLDEDFEALLRKLNVFDQVKAGEATCEFCNHSVDISTIAMVFPKDGRVCYCCEKKDCVDKLLKQRGVYK